MAERRMLHRKISVSADLAALDHAHGRSAVLFYTWLIPHLDRWGCAPADPATLRAQVIPLFDDITNTDVRRWVTWMIRRGLLERVEGPNGDHGIKVPRFHDHQAGSRFDRETPSRYEPPDVTKQWKRRRTPKPTDSRAVPDESRTSPGRVPLKGKELKPFPPTPHGASTEDEEAPPGGDPHRLAPRPEDHHDQPNTNGHRHNTDLEHAGTTAHAILHRLRTRQDWRGR